MTSIIESTASRDGGRNFPCALTSIVRREFRHNEADWLTDFLQEVQERTDYHYWLFGYYHDNRMIDAKHILLWEQIVQIL